VYSSSLGNILTRLSEEDIASRWASAATKGASNVWHIDCSGLCTFIYMWIGAKVWIVYENVSHGETKDYRSLSRPEFKAEPTAMIECHPVILGPGDRL
jgi:hypothetical protein